jgi:hypothetical protein
MISEQSIVKMEITPASGNTHYEEHTDELCAFTASKNLTVIHKNGH